MLIWDNKLRFDKCITPDHKVSVQCTHDFLKWNIDKPLWISPVKTNFVKLCLPLWEMLHLKPTLTDSRNNLSQLHASELFRPIISCLYGRKQLITVVPIGLIEVV